MKPGFTTLHLPRALTGAVAGVFGRLAARPARLLLRISGAQQKAFAFATLLGLSAAAFAATPPNSTISNTATATYSVGANSLSATSTATVNTAACMDVSVKIELLQYIPPAGAALAPAETRTEAVQPAGYAPSGAVAGPFTPLVDPTLHGDPAATPLPANLLLAPLSDAAGKPIAAYSRNEPIFVRVVSYDANITATADTIAVTLTTNGGDSEVLQLTETGPSTGVFIGAVQSVFAAPGTAPTHNDGKLTIAAHNETITGVYNDLCPSGSNIPSSSSALIDPYGIVFDSATGAPVAGATVKLLISGGPQNGQLATVFCDDGVTVLPQPVTSGSPTICDAAMIAGGFRFPQVAAGSYQITITPPGVYAYPSAMPVASLPALVGAPPVAPAILGNPGLTPGGSYGGVFTLWGPALKVDIPVDPGSMTMTIRKSAGKSVVGTGDFVPYTLAITNNSTTLPLIAGSVADHLPPGFRYQTGSARLDGVPAADPLISADAAILTFSLNIAATATTTIQYVLEVTPGARTGTAENTAVATGNTTSNTARASVLVREDLYRNKSLLIGRVIDGSCDDKVDNDEKGLANARIVLQDGSYILTDQEGRWHIDNLRPGTHVVQLDMDSLPRDYEVVSCEQNSRFAGRKFSQFVNLRPGSLWRADFHVQKKAAVATASKVLVDTPATTSATTPMDNDPIRLVEKLPYNEGWLAAAQPGNEWLHPQESFHPNLPAMKVAVKHDPRHTLVLTVNGAAVNPLLFDGTQMNAARNVALSAWNTVPVNEGDNKIELLIRDADGKEVSRTVRNIHYAATPDHVEFVPQLSRLVADGKTRPMIAVRFLDKDGIPVRRGISGEFMLNKPYRSYERHEGIEREPLTGRIGGMARYEVKSDGLAMIELEPTTQSGEAILNFHFNDQRKQEVRSWLKAGQRDWILVGFGEGTLGHKTLSGNLHALQGADADKELFDDNKLAFYAKGSIRGDTLLTVAYDSARQTGNSVLKQTVDPTQYYTLYADATQASFDAASASRLYVKLERKQFYAMFGDYDTGLTVTELSRYSRTLNGVKSEYKGDTLGYNAFATVTAQAYVKDDIPGNGTSGVYKLSRGNLMVNSDKVRIETRDRFQSQSIVSTRSLTRYLDYDIDYHNGALTFREPVNVRDGGFNPIYIVAEYESADPADEKASFGGRGSVKPVKGIEIGATLVHEGTVGATGDLKGVDATYQLDDKTRLRAEVAATNRTLASIPSNGSAWLGEVTHHEEQWDAKTYLREQDGAFGIGQQAASEIATRKYGVDGRFKLSDTAQFQGQTYQQQNLTNSTQNSVLEGRVDNRISDDLSAYYGARMAQDQNATGTAMQSNQLLGGAAYSMLDKRLSLHTSAEISGGSAGSSTMPDRLILGGDYKVTEQSKLFAEQEFARGELISANTTRVGIRTQPWMGNEMLASVGNTTHNDAERIYSNLGMVQRWQIDEHWQTNFSVDRSQTLKNTAEPLNLNTPLPSGSGGISQLPSASGDYTATAFSLAYHDKLWSSDGRIELRDSSLDQQRNLQLGLQRQLDSGRTLAAGFTRRQAGNLTGSTLATDLRFSYAHRPNDSRWVWFDRVDYITQSTQTAQSTQNTGTSLKGKKLVNNLHVNYMPGRRTQISLQYGAKYVLDTINSTDYTGYTDLTGAEVRHDLTKRWDIGAFASVMRSVNSGVNSYGLGASIGYKLVDNMWLSVGYNVRGMDDRDFANASYRAQGAYITLRMKVDQDTFGLNRGGEIIRPMTPE